MKYSDLLAIWLKDMGYTHCFYVAGGNIMHLLASCNSHFKMVAVIHEVAAGIATEYFNESNPSHKAFALVTAGPGLTNLVTAFAGAFLESRELLVLGGQVKTTDLSRGCLRQRGIQEIDGVSIVKTVTKISMLIDEPLTKEKFEELVVTGATGRKGPIFLEIPLDIQGRTIVFPSASERSTLEECSITIADQTVVVEIANKIKKSIKPVILMGGGISRLTAQLMHDRFSSMGIPVMTTWNGADRLECSHPNYFGRPNTWGQRYSNILIQQCDLLIALGTRLGMQQTGFNWKQFIPYGEIIQVDCDKAELEKGHPNIHWGICADANSLLVDLSDHSLGQHEAWLSHCRRVKEELPIIEKNQTRDGYISPYHFVEKLSELCKKDDVLIPCSSGGAFTVMMQVFAQKIGQKIVTNKGLASMGYGLSGSIGASLANPKSRTILVEGDGGFAQNLQELGTVSINHLNLKMFIFDDSGYASIRMTQKNYFGGGYIGCDIESGLGLPDWEKLLTAYSIPVMRISAGYENDDKFVELFDSKGPAAFIVTIDPEQTYFPKISSRITESGTMESNPLHIMTPDLSSETINLLEFKIT